MSLDPRRSAFPPSELILAAFARIGLDPTNPEHREEWVKFVAWGYEQFGDYIKQEQNKDLNRRERKARVWTLVIALTSVVASVTLTYFVKR